MWCPFVENKKGPSGSLLVEDDGRMIIGLRLVGLFACSSHRLQSADWWMLQGQKQQPCLSTTLLFSRTCNDWPHTTLSLLLYSRTLVKHKWLFIQIIQEITCLLGLNNLPIFGPIQGWIVFHNARNVQMSLRCLIFLDCDSTTDSWREAERHIWSVIDGNCSQNGNEYFQ